jgi:uncharacterized membrane protein HdeD (DUF308 family)
MTDQDTQATRRRLGMAGACAVLALLAVLAPWMARTAPAERVGVLLAAAAIVEIAHGFRRSGRTAQRSAWLDGLVTLAMGILLINAPWVAGAALILLLAGWFLIDSVRQFAGAVRALRTGMPLSAFVLPGLGNLAVAVALLVLARPGAAGAIAIAGALRILGTAWNIMSAPVFSAADSDRTALEDLGLPDRQELGDAVGQSAHPAEGFAGPFAEALPVLDGKTAELDESTPHRYAGDGGCGVRMQERAPGPGEPHGRHHGLGRHPVRLAESPFERRVAGARRGTDLTDREGLVGAILEVPVRLAHQAVPTPLGRT